MGARATDDGHPETSLTEADFQELLIGKGWQKAIIMGYISQRPLIQIPLTLPTRERNQARVAGVLGSWAEGRCRLAKATEGPAWPVPRGTTQNEEDLWRNIS
jgi:hypothetical protein